MYPQVLQQGAGDDKGSENKEEDCYDAVDPEPYFRITEHLDLIGKNAFQDVGQQDHSQGTCEKHGNGFPVAPVG